jgi:hypothetical protein
MWRADAGAEERAPVGVQVEGVLHEGRRRGGGGGEVAADEDAEPRGGLLEGRVPGTLVHHHEGARGDPDPHCPGPERGLRVVRGSGGRARRPGVEQQGAVLVGESVEVHERPDPERAVDGRPPAAEAQVGVVLATDVRMPGEEGAVLIGEDSGGQLQVHVLPQVAPDGVHDGLLEEERGEGRPALDELGEGQPGGRGLDKGSKERRVRRVTAGPPEGLVSADERLAEQGEFLGGVGTLEDGVSILEELPRVRVDR